MTEAWPCRCGCYRAGAQEVAYATYRGNIDAAREREASEDIAAGRTTVALSAAEMFAALARAERHDRTGNGTVPSPAEHGDYRNTVRVSPFEGVTVVRWADKPEPVCDCRAKGQPMTPFGVYHLADCLWLAEFCCGGCAGDDEPHIIRGTE